MATITKLSQNLWHISLPFQNEQEIIGAYVFSGKNELAIIDPGPASTADALLSSIREAGFELEAVTHLLLTHIHLDHAGAVGTILPHMPNAKVYVHSKGADHLVDPSRFLASVTRVFGERTRELWGETKPVEKERVQVIEGGDVLTIAGRRLEVHYTPGHAVHHVVFFDVHSGELFTGDIAGVRLQGIDYVRPPTPPPDLDLESWSNSLDSLKHLHSDILYLAHFGPVKNPTQQMERVREKLFMWGDFVLSAMRDGKPAAEITRDLAAYTEPDLQRIAGNVEATKRYDLAVNYPMMVQGYMRYWQKRHPELL